MHASDTDRADGPAGAADSWGLLRAGSALLALRVDALQEVIACPADLDALPCDAPGICGAVRLRDQVIPVLDLRVVLGLPTQVPRPDAVIVLMRHAHRLLGLRTDAVLGMARVEGASLQDLHRHDPQATAIATCAFAVGDQVATVLDPARIAALPGVPMVSMRPSIAAATMAAAQGEPLLLFECGGSPLALAAQAVGATVPEIAVRPSPLARGVCLGVFEHHGLELPVVDLGAVLGRQAVPRPADLPVRTALLVLRLPQGQVGLTMDRVSDIVRVAAGAIVPAPALGLAKPGLYRGLVEAPAQAEEPARPHLLLDDRALAQDPLLAALSGLSRPVGPADAGVTAGAADDGRLAAQARAARAGTVLTYDAGIELASPLTQISEIIPLPVHLLDGGRSASAALGVFTHRGTAVPLVDLTSLLRGSPGQARPDPEQRVLIVDASGQRVGFMVEGLGTIETAHWEGPDRREAGEAFDVRQFSRRPPLVEVGEAGARRTLGRLDLQQLVRALHA